MEDNDFSTASLQLSLNDHPEAPAVYQTTVSAPQATWFTPNAPLPNSLAVKATLEDTPTSAGLLGIVMLIDSDR